MQSIYFLPTGYAPSTIKDIPVTLTFKETVANFRNLFGLNEAEIPLCVRKYVNYQPPKNGAETEAVQENQKINGKPRFKGVAGRIVIFFDEIDGWLYVHADPPVAQRIVEVFNESKGKPKYRAMEVLFGRYIRNYMKRSMRTYPQTLSSDFDRLDALLAEGQSMRANHQKMDEAFYTDEGLEHLIGAKNLGDFISVKPMEISDMLVKEKDLKPEQLAITDVR